MKKRLLACAFASSLLVQGCAGMADAMNKASGVGQVSQEVSTFDNATIINLSPAFLYGGGGMMGNGFKLGARWNSNTPDSAVLVLAQSSSVSAGSAAYTNFKGVSISIDGDQKRFNIAGPTNHTSSSYNTVTRTIYTQSTASVIVPLALVEKMVTVKDCRIRIHSGDGYEDALFHMERIPGGQGTAIPAFREYLAKVDSQRKR